MSDNIGGKSPTTTGELAQRLEFLCRIGGEPRANTGITPMIQGLVKAVGLEPYMQRPFLGIRNTAGMWEMCGIRQDEHLFVIPPSEEDVVYFRILESTVLTAAAALCEANILGDCFYPARYRAVYYSTPEKREFAKRSSRICPRCLEIIITRDWLVKVDLLEKSVSSDA